MKTKLPRSCRLLAVIFLSLAASLTPCRALETGVITLVSTGACWHFHDRGFDLGTNWIFSGSDDSAWSLGFAELGYGDGDEATVVSFGSDPNNKYITTYFRHKFVVPDPGAFTNLQLRIKRDDGAVVFLNGTQVYRSNVANGQNYLTLAALASNDGTNFLNANISPALLLTNDNFLAVEIHQAATNDSDISFDLGLFGQYATSGPSLSVASASGGRLVLSWPTSVSSNYVLQTASQLTSAVWTNVSGTIVLAGGKRYVTNTITPSAKFYRLCAATLSSSLPCQPPLVVSQPLMFVGDIGTNITLSIVATGTPTITYQWFHNTFPVPGANTATLTITNAQRPDGGFYELCMGGPCGFGFSCPITVLIGGTNFALADNFASRPVFTADSGEINASDLLASAELGEPAHVGHAALRSVWMSYVAPFDGVVTFDTTGSAFDTLLAAYHGTGVGALSLIDEDDDHGPVYTSRISFAVTNGEPIELAVDSYPGNSGAFQLNWNLVATNEVAPLILVQPQSQLIPIGSNFTVFVTATNPGSLVPLTYQWRLNTSNLVGATSSSLTVSNAQAADAGLYDVVISNGFFSKTSQTANIAFSVGTGQLINVGGSKRLKCGTYYYTGRYPATGTLNTPQPFRVNTTVSSVSTIFTILATRASTLTAFCTSSGVLNDPSPTGTYPYYFEVLSATAVTVYTEIQ